MAPRIVSLLALVLLGACEPIKIRPIPPEEREPVQQELAAGRYVVTVEGVAALQCEGVPPRALIGQRIEGQLRVGDEEVAFDLGGFVLHGDMIPGALFVEGEEEPVYYDYDDDVDVDSDDGGYGDDEGYGEDAPGGGSAPDEGRGCGETEPAYEGDEDRPDGGAPGEDRPDGDRPDGDYPDDDCPDDDPRPPSVAYAAIDARILDSAHAEGRMTLLSDGCAMELEVAIAAGELDDDEIVYEEETEPAPGEGREDAPGSDR